MCKVYQYAEIDQNSFEKYNDPGEAKWVSHDAYNHQIPLKTDKVIEEFAFENFYCYQSVANIAKVSL